MSLWVLRTIALCEVVGGVHGLILCSVDVAKRGLPNAELPLYALVMCFFLLSVAAGVLLWRNTRAGYVATIIVLLIQLPKLLYPQLVYTVSTGFDVSAMMLARPGPPPASGLKFHAQIGSFYLLHPESGPGSPRGIGISLVSCVAFWLLVRCRRAMTAAARTNPTRGHATTVSRRIA